MSIIPQLLPLEINSEKKRKILLENVVRMLTNRHLLDENKLENNISKIISSNSDDMLYTINLDHPELYYPKLDSTKNMYVKLLLQKVSGVSKTSNIGEFLNQHKNHPKIIIVSSITTTASDVIRNDYPFSEVFLEKDLMIDKVRHISVPEHELLSEEDTKKVLEEYMIKKREMPKIFISDPISRYYNAKVNQIFKITRPSETSGLAPYHRLVIKGNILNN